MESGLPFQSISLAVEKARLEGQNKDARRPKRSPRPPDGSCLSQNPASGCRDAGEKGGEGPGGHICRTERQVACVGAGEGESEDCQPRCVCLVGVRGLLERETEGMQVVALVVEGKADSQSRE